MSSTEAMLIIQLHDFKWDERHPFPTVGTLAARLGVSPRHVRDTLKSMQERGYLEEDWDCYARMRDGKQSGVTTLHPLAGARFKFANENDQGESGGDGLYILAPDKTLVEEASQGDDINDGSYVILYRSVGGRIIIPGDAHDGTWEYVGKHYADDVENCSILVAPHHGRDSDRSYDFLDHMKPKLTLFGSAPYEHQAHEAWNDRGLPFITSDQAGNIVLDILSNKINVYVENEEFAPAGNRKNEQGYTLWGWVDATPEKK